MWLSKYWPFKSNKEGNQKMPKSVAVALALSVISLAMSFAMTRWCLIILGEQIKLRNAVTNLGQQLQSERSQNNMMNRRFMDQRMMYGGMRPGVPLPPGAMVPPGTAAQPLTSPPTTKPPTTKPTTTK